MNYAYKHLKTFEEYDVLTHRMFANKVRGRGIKWTELSNDSLELARKHLSQFEGQEIKFFNDEIGETNLIIGDIHFDTNGIEYNFNINPKMEPEKSKSINIDDPYNEEDWEEERTEGIRQLRFICRDENPIILRVILNRKVEGWGIYKEIVASTDRKGAILLKRIIKTAINKDISLYQINRYK